MIRVSVIVPVYNARNHVEKTLRSILEQDLSGFEVIVVNDGSTDDSAEIVDHVFNRSLSHGLSAKRIDQVNSGVSVARNTGVAHAAGEYVMFFDSDDLMNPGCLRKLYSRAQEASSDITACGYDLADEAGEIIFPFSDSYSYFDGKMGGQDAALTMLKDLFVFWTGSMLYRADFLAENSLEFFPGCANGQDTEFILKALYTARSVACVRASLVRYVQRSASASRVRNMRIFHIVGAMKRLACFLYSRGASTEMLWLMENRWIPNAYVDSLTSIAIGEDSRKRLQRLLRNRAIRKALSDYTPTSRRRLPKAFLLRHFPYIYFKYRAFTERKDL